MSVAGFKSRKTVFLGDIHFVASRVHAALFPESRRWKIINKIRSQAIFTVPQLRTVPSWPAFPRTGTCRKSVPFCSIVFHVGLKTGLRPQPGLGWRVSVSGMAMPYFYIAAPARRLQIGDAKVRTGVHRWSGRVTGVGGEASKARTAAADNSRSGSQSRQFLLLHPSPSPRSSSTPGYVSLRERRLAASE